MSGLVAIWKVTLTDVRPWVAGGLPALVWGGALRAVWVYHVTWFVNSASHVWGSQAFNTGDQSRNNWWGACDPPRLHAAPRSPAEHLCSRLPSGGNACGILLKLP